MHDMINEFYTEDSDKVVREPKTPDCEKFDACDKITTCITPNAFRFTIKLFFCLYKKLLICP